MGRGTRKKGVNQAWSDSPLSLIRVATIGALERSDCMNEAFVDSEAWRW